MALEEATYEEERADSEEFLRKTAEVGVGLVARDSENDELLGFVFAGPIEHFFDVPGPDRDPLRGQGVALYAADLTVAESARGRGVGRSLKTAQIEWARRHGYRFVCGRNKIGATDEMVGLNRSLGSYTAMVLDKQYDGNSQAEYYRIPLVHPVPGKKQSSQVSPPAPTLRFAPVGTPMPSRGCSTEPRSCGLTRALALA